jgi:hypothetical protein
MFTTYNTDINRHTDEIEREILGPQGSKGSFHKQLSKKEYNLHQVKVEAIKRGYPIIVEPSHGKYWYLKGYGYNYENLKKLIEYKIYHKTCPKSILYFINEPYSRR